MNHSYLNQLIFILVFTSASVVKCRFECVSDGLFEDLNDCQMYFECTWVNTEYAKIEHLKCPENFVYSPIKHRCDSLKEINYKFNNNQINKTTVNLVEFIRLKNCFSQKKFKELNNLGIIIDKINKYLSENKFDELNKSYLNKPKYLGTFKKVDSKFKYSNLVDLIMSKQKNFFAKRKLLALNDIDEENEDSESKTTLFDYSSHQVTDEAFNKNEDSDSLDLEIIATDKNQLIDSIEQRLTEKFNKPDTEKNINLTTKSIPSSSLSTSTEANEFNLVDIFNELLKLNETSTPITTTEQTSFTSTKPNFYTITTPLTTSTRFTIPAFTIRNMNYTETELAEPLIGLDYEDIKVPKNNKYQRLSLAPEDTLIECKENDFGLECSCSITLSPPKCKGLINSFLSSCKIIGCKNNGKCISIAYKYPIPYVCSCPSMFMGSYCEITREQLEATSSKKYPYMKTKQPVSENKFYTYERPIIITKTTTTKKTTTTTTTTEPLPILDEFLQEIPKIEFREPACNPNPCMNFGKCIIIADRFECKCLNSSFSGKLCQIFTFAQKKTPAITTTTIIPKFSYKNIFPTRKALTYITRPKVQPILTTTYYNHLWQCPSNCHNNVGRGFCTLDTLSNPKCVCNGDWTGHDCSVKNYCLYNRCTNNSTCVNHAASRSYICLCPTGYSGNYCEIMLKLKYVDESNLDYNGLENDEITMSTSARSIKSKNSISNKCKNNATFSKTSQKCKCKKGFYGKKCEFKSTNPCKSNPCHYPASECVSISSNKYECKCSNSTENCLNNSETNNVINLKKLSILNVCESDSDLCIKYPNGNKSFICMPNSLNQEYTQCIPAKSINCIDNNPCLNGGLCIQNNDMSLMFKAKDESVSFKCICADNYTGQLCETSFCSSIHSLLPNHSMCASVSSNLIPEDTSINGTDLILIVDLHNKIRKNVNPSSGNMQKMYWDKRLEILAQKRAQMCSVESAGLLTRQLPGYGVVIGENLAAGYEKWQNVIESWMSENSSFIFKSNLTSDNQQTGHFTQMIYSSASRIGCGYAQCSDSEYSTYFVCYYAEMQTHYTRYEPYLEGESCSMCKNNCDDKLCDCKGKYCLNGGKLDLETCTCTCPYSQFTGKYCENIICPKEDSQFCSKAMFEHKCWLYPVIRATCPYMCSLCKNDNETFTINELSQKSFNYTELQNLIDNTLIK